MMPHLPPLRIRDNILRGRFAADCATIRCRGNCCRGGVSVDLAERDAILANSTSVQRFMEPQAEHDPAKWFNAESHEDGDFPSGRFVRTALHNGACVFLDSQGLCVLQKSSEPQQTTLKPFYCRAFPITVEHGELAVDKGFDPNCCTLADDGVRDVFEVCPAELECVLGTKGFEELRDLIRKS